MKPIDLPGTSSLPSRPPPTADAQLAFLRNLQRLLDEGSFVSTYKYALLHALADLAVLHGDDSGAPLPLTTWEIAEQLVVLYWNHTAPFPGLRGGAAVLRQNTQAQTAILNHIARAQREGDGLQRTLSLGRFMRQRDAWRRLVKKVERVVKEMPLWKLQTVKGGQLEFLYPNRQEGERVRGITLRPGVAYCLRAFHPLVTGLVRSAWVRFVRLRNHAELGEAADLSAFLFGAARGDLSPFVPLLRDEQHGRCFYCGEELRPRRQAHVDHFIPWAKYPADLGHNFVLAHAGCNADKSDLLAAEVHLERWCQRNEHRGAELARAFDELGLAHDQGASLRVAGWSYAQAHAAGARVWQAPKAPLVPLGDAWRTWLQPTIPLKPGLVR